MAESNLRINIHPAWWVRPAATLIIGSLVLTAPITRRVAPRLVLRLFHLAVRFVTKHGFAYGRT